jgi:hypothetical protein
MRTHESGSTFLAVGALVGTLSRRATADRRDPDAGEGGGVVIALVVAMAGLMAALVVLGIGTALFVGGGR